MVGLISVNVKIEVLVFGVGMIVIDSVMFVELNDGVV